MQKMKLSCIISTILICSALFIFSSCNGNGDPEFITTIEFEMPATGVFERGAPGSWDSYTVGWCSVLPDGDTLRMWYNANNSSDRLYKIGYAWSVDGLSWDRHSEPVLWKTMAWEGIDIMPGPVIKDDDTFSLWYLCYDGAYSIAVGKATSQDGINWSKHDAPVMNQQQGMSHIGLYSVIREDNTLLGWYEEKTAEPWWEGRVYIGSATSVDDGLTWELQGKCLYASEGYWDSKYVDQPLIQKTKNKSYEMIYRGFTEDLKPRSFGFATSDNGIDWTKEKEYSPLIDGPTGSGEVYVLNTAICDKPNADEYHLWFTHILSSTGDGWPSNSVIKHVYGRRVEKEVD